MTHEFKNIIENYINSKALGIRSVLATVVDLDGSSYRKPGVRMLILENEQMIGAVSGGCVEKDILRQASSVFKNGKSLMMTYDGRYRLGCEGVLYILLELFEPEIDFLNAFQKCIENRNDFKIESHYKKDEGSHSGLGSYIEFQKIKYPASQKMALSEDRDKSLSVFVQIMPPCFKLMIFGAEHDAVQLCQFAALNGWEVSIITGPLESKTINNFPGATAFFSASPDTIEIAKIDSETAIVLMSHNFANDLKFLIELKDSNPAYLGMLGPAHRREKLLTQLLEYCPEIEMGFLDNIHGPAGLNIGAETPQEIAISILSEILTVIRNKKPILLKEKNGGIHA